MVKKKYLALMLLGAITSFSIYGCGNSNEEHNNDNNNVNWAEVVKNVISIEKTDTNGNVDTYTVTCENGYSFSFEVTNGLNGEQGIQGEKGEDGHTPVITIGENGNWIIDGVDTGISAKGEKGDTGEKGEDGLTPFIGENGNWWIGEKDTGVKAEGTDGTSSRVEIGENGNWFIDGVDTGITAYGEDGADGTDGEDGLSAYEIYIKYHPEYTGSEEERINDFVSGDLGNKEMCTIQFDLNGGTMNEPLSIEVEKGTTIDNIPIPKKEGKKFYNWVTGFESYSSIFKDTTVVTKNLILIAAWDSYDYTFLDENNNVVATKTVYNPEDEDDAITVEPGEVFTDKFNTQYGYAIGNYDARTLNSDYSFKPDVVISYDDYGEYSSVDLTGVYRNVETGKYECCLVLSRTFAENSPIVDKLTIPNTYLGCKVTYYSINYGDINNLIIEEGIENVSFNETKIANIEGSDCDGLSLNFNYGNGTDDINVDLSKFNIKMSEEFSFTLNSNNQNINIILPEGNDETSTANFNFYGYTSGDLSISNFDYLNNKNVCFELDGYQSLSIDNQKENLHLIGSYLTGNINTEGISEIIFENCSGNLIVKSKTTKILRVINSGYSLFGLFNDYNGASTKQLEVLDLTGTYFEGNKIIGWFNRDYFPSLKELYLPYSEEELAELDGGGNELFTDGTVTIHYNCK